MNSRRSATAIGLVILVGVVVTFSLMRRAGPLEGGIVLRSLQCVDESGQPVVRLLAQNQTNRRLRDLEVHLSLGEGENLVAEERLIQLVEKGGFVSLEEELSFDGEVSVCFARFFYRGQQIPSAYRP